MIRNFSKNILRQYFFGHVVQKDVHQIAEWFVSKNEDSEFYKELSVVWNELPESIDKTEALRAHHRFAGAIAPTNINREKKAFLNAHKLLFGIAAAFVVSLFVWSL